MTLKIVEAMEDIANGTTEKETETVSEEKKAPKAAPVKAATMKKKKMEPKTTAPVKPDLPWEGITLNRCLLVASFVALLSMGFQVMQDVGDIEDDSAEEDSSSWALPENSIEEAAAEMKEPSFFESWFGFSEPELSDDEIGPILTAQIHESLKKELENKGLKRKQIDEKHKDIKVTKTKSIKMKEVLNQSSSLKQKTSATRTVSEKKPHKERFEEKHEKFNKKVQKEAKDLGYHHGKHDSKPKEEQLTKQAKHDHHQDVGKYGHYRDKKQHDEVRKHKYPSDAGKYDKDSETGKHSHRGDRKKQSDTAQYDHYVGSGKHKHQRDAEQHNKHSTDGPYHGKQGRYQGEEHKHFHKYFKQEGDNSHDSKKHKDSRQYQERDLRGGHFKKGEKFTIKKGEKEKFFVKYDYRDVKRHD
ncbi:junctional sarcoplasmic reticulum protein 1 isoform X3 [Protopterus annectens]|nr:junctional sarcoplasmic reticulum protein 1 isoform X3 [Protopterus annectens]